MTKRDVAFSDQTEEGSAAGEPAGLSAEDYRAAFEASPDGILIADASGRIRGVNPQLLDLFGYEPGELQGRPVEILVPEAARDDHVKHRTAYTESPHARPMGIGLELRGVRKDGTEVPVEISLSPLEKDDETLVIATVRDVTGRRRLRDFGAGALRAAEEERHRIARELHDDTAQRLSGLLIRLRLAKDVAGPTDRRAVFDSMREEILECAEGIRRIARGLRPPALEDAGVAPAIRSHVRALQATTDARLHVEAEPVEHLLDGDSRLVLYRVLQEAISNALRHGEPEHVRIRIGSRDGWVVGVVEDDGRGFDPEERERSGGGLGILGMTERAALVGGRVSVESVSGEGTTVRVEIPSNDHPS